jgi:hypothetical protein
MVFVGGSLSVKSEGSGRFVDDDENDDTRAREFCWVMCSTTMVRNSIVTDFSAAPGGSGGGSVGLMK